MAAVALAVGGLLEGAEHERCIRLAAVPAPRGLAAGRAGSPRRRPGPPPGPRAPGPAAASAPRAPPAARPGVRSGPGRAGRGRGRSPAPARAARRSATCSLVRIISRSIRRCASVWATRVGADDVAVGVEAELRLGRFDVEAGGAALLAEGGGDRARGRERFGDLLRRRRAAGEDRVELVVVEAGVGADAAAVEAGRARLRPRPQLDLRRHRQPLDPRRQAAGLAAERVRQHRLDRAGDVGAVGAPARLDVERRARPHVGGDVGDVDPDPGPVALALGGDGVVEVAGGGRVDGEGRERGEVAAGAGVALAPRAAASRASASSAGAEAAEAELLAQQRLDRLAGARQLLALARARRRRDRGPLRPGRGRAWRRRLNLRPGRRGRRAPALSPRRPAFPDRRWP